jgi:hypothetical protein
MNPSHTDHKVLENPVDPQLRKKFVALFGTQELIIIIMRVKHGQYVEPD